MKVHFIKRAGLSILATVFCFPCWAAIELAFPTERAVFQRDNSNNGFVTVMGVAEKDAEWIEGRLVPMVLGQGQETDWKKVDGELLAGTFSGKIEGRGGWYRLELRSLKAGQVMSTSSLQRVGIGEVIIFSGQSNAQGFGHLTSRGANDDRVNCYGYYKDEFIEESLPLSQFVHLDKTINIGPHGQSAWAWGELGDLMVAKFNVPVMFFNTAFEGTVIQNWLSSLKGQPTAHTFYGFTFQKGGPYSFLRIILQKQIQMYGMRAVVWIQGESDYMRDTNEYYNDLKAFIEGLGDDVGFPVNWVLTKTSYVNQPHEAILKAQQKVIDELANVYQGPLTDTLGIPRIDGVHFSFSGLSELANAMGQYFEQNLNKLKAFQGRQFAELQADCTNNGVTAKVSLKESYDKVVWNGTLSGATYQISNGYAQAEIKDSEGNFGFSELLKHDNLLPETPILNTDKGTLVCDGTIVTVRPNRDDYEVLWQDGSVQPAYQVGETMLLMAKYKTRLGCVSKSSGRVNIRVEPNPVPPDIVSANERFGACEGETITLKALSPAANVEWSTGSQNRNLEVKELGIQKFTAKAISKYGCVSLFADSVQVNIFSKPEVPSIVQEGPFSMAVTKPETYSRYDWYMNDALVRNENMYQLIGNDGQHYTVVAYENHALPFEVACPSYPSESFLFTKVPTHSGILAYPNPVYDGKVFLASDRLVEGAEVSLSSMNGHTVFEKQSVQDIFLPQTIRFTYRLQGLYILTVYYEGRSQRFKLFFK